MESNVEEISLKEIASALWVRRLIIVGITLGFALAAAIFSLTLPKKYESTIIVSPIDDEGGDRLGSASSLLSQFGGLSALGGLNLGGGRKSEAIATLQSAALTDTFIEENKLLPILFKDQWDADKQKWKNQDEAKQPTLWKAELKFRSGIRSIVEDKKTGLVTLTITWGDPKEASQWANDLVARANGYLRGRAIEQSNRNLDYLNQQLTKTSVVELQKAIYSVIESEIKKVMIASGNNEYAFRIIDPARTPELKSGPKRTLITLVGAFAGFILSCILALALPRKQN